MNIQELQLEYTVHISVKDQYGGTVFVTECKLDEIDQELIIMEDEVQEYDLDMSYTGEDYDDFGGHSRQAAKEEQEEIKKIVSKPKETKMALVPVKVNRDKFKKYSYI